MPFVELGTRGPDHEQRHRLGAVGQVLEEREHRVVGPVQVLEDEHGRALLGDVLEEPPPRGEQLVALGRDVASIPSSGSSRCRNHARSAPSGRTASSFAVATSGGSDSRIPAWALTISPSAQKVMPSPYGRHRP